MSSGSSQAEAALWSITTVPMITTDQPTVRYLVDLFAPYRTSGPEPGSIPSASKVVLSFITPTGVADEIEGRLAALELDGARILVVVDGPPTDLLQLQFLRHLLAGQDVVGWRDVDSNQGGESWLGACVNYSRYVTPWVWGQGTGGGDSTGIPSTVEASIEPSAFQSRAQFFCLLGESIWGHGGYMGRDLDGLAEIVGNLSQLTCHLRVRFREATILRQKTQPYSTHLDFFDEVVAILRGGGVEVTVEP